METSSIKDVIVPSASVETASAYFRAISNIIAQDKAMLGGEL